MNRLNPLLLTIILLLELLVSKPMLTNASRQQDTVPREKTKLGLRFMFLKCPSGHCCPFSLYCCYANACCSGPDEVKMMQTPC
ncbi:unnamed protein product [Nezara viridula]|uniref:Neuropeptide n=1 Tax=Nezara viridula TaxID=85310 RepID=A0A9P0HSE6_NEZVI|nr:unnamed protein product [Nezara viridula]